MTGSGSPQVEALYDPATSTVSYVVYDRPGGRAAIIDPVLDFDLRSGRTSYQSADRLIDLIRDRALEVDWILETHVHADHLTAAPYLRRRLGGRIGIGAGVVEVQRHFRPVFNPETGFPSDGSQFDHLFADEERFSVGEVEGRVLFTGGHTNDSVSYVIGDAVFVGDTLFMPDGGTARCDFPGGDAGRLYDSIQRIFALPDETRLFVCHDYQPDGREVRWETTVGEQKARNIHVGAGRDRDAFIRMRTERDRTLALPTLIVPSVQVNMRAGHLPPPEDNGVRYLKIPLDQL